jgi:hypothetical protein
VPPHKGYIINRVTTYPDQTLIVYANYGGLGGANYVVFSDINNNGRLDKADKKLSEYSKSLYGEACPNHEIRPTKDRGGGDGTYFCLTSVNKEDISEFGTEVRNLIRSARMHRKSLTSELKTTKFSNQSCMMLDSDERCVKFEANFKPPLSVKTRIYSQIDKSEIYLHGTRLCFVCYAEADIKDTMSDRPSENPPIEKNPADCIMVSAYFMTRWKGKEVNAEIMIGCDDALGLVILGEQYFDLVNRLAVPDVSISRNHDRDTRRVNVELPFDINHVDLGL